MGRQHRDLILRVGGLLEAGCVYVCFVADFPGGVEGWQAPSLGW